MNIITPKPHQAGYVVINSDDGKELDYLNWFRVIKRTAQKNNSWYPYRGSSFCPAVSPGFMNGLDARGDRQMRGWQYKEIADKQGEILSHTFKHCYLDFIDVSQPINIGDTIVHYDFDARAIIEGYKYTIEEDGKVETVLVKKVNANQSFETAPISQSFSVNAKIHITEESARQDFQNTIDTLASVGVTCKHHVDPYYSNSERCGEWLKDYFESVVTTQISDSRPQPIENINLYDIKRTRDSQHFTETLVNDILDETRELNTVLFVQGHGWHQDGRLEMLEYIVEQIYARGLRLITHSEAVEFIKKRQSEL